MRVGIVILPEQRWSEAAPRWQRAEAYGFDHAWSYDHLGCQLGDFLSGPWFDVVPTLTAAAMTTSTIGLGTLVTSPNFRHPVAFARQALALDDISRGRFRLGLGSGGGGYDRIVLAQSDLSPRQRTARFNEFVEVMDGVLTHDRFNHQGVYYQAVDARNAPGCLRRPRLPFVVAANGPRAMRVAARFGQAWLTGPIAEEIHGNLAADLNGWWKTVGELVARFNEILAEEGRDPGTIDRYITLDGSPVLSMSSKNAFAEHAGRAAELGFTDLITHWPRPHGIYQASETVLEEIAAEILPQLHSTP
ncbi:LLM class flavin-dependent oxidoreductase [Streptomyces sp. 3211]|uniref:LLM class flavin-dependent oxidoreductase n=1 Tax=Streptomyces sp. 3211 TaxID=1964449 RepID=UPI0009A4B359|nr:LLM class flavin-dependent oxidoreductase [Streptomyces sp. 3211]